MDYEKCERCGLVKKAPSWAVSALVRDREIDSLVCFECSDELQYERLIEDGNTGRSLLFLSTYDTGEPVIKVGFGTIVLPVIDYGLGIVRFSTPDGWGWQGTVGSILKQVFARRMKEPVV